MLHSKFLKWLAAGGVAVVLAATAPAQAHAQTSGRYEGAPPKVAMGDDGRSMTLLEPFAFIDTDNRRWEAPSGTVTDGASIPQFLWTVVGGPFEGKFRWAAIIHDRYCEIRTRPTEDTHKAFYDAMLVAGVDIRRAWLMYRAVTSFGPSWPRPQVNPACRMPDGTVDYSKCTENSAVTRSLRVSKPKPTKKSVEEFLKEVQGQADPADIEKLRREIQKLK